MTNSRCCVRCWQFRIQAGDICPTVTPSIRSKALNDSSRGRLCRPRLPAHNAARFARSAWAYEHSCSGPSRTAAATPSSGRSCAVARVQLARGPARYQREGLAHNNETTLAKVASVVVAPTGESTLNRLDQGPHARTSGFPHRSARRPDRSSMRRRSSRLPQECAASVKIFTKSHHVALLRYAERQTAPDKGPARW